MPEISMTSKEQEIIPIEIIERRVYLIRGRKVMLDQDLAELYEVETKVFNQAVTRNKEKFPEDFAFLLTKQEFADLRSQIVTSSWGGRRHPPRAFTQEGIAMLSGVLRSNRAVQINIAIMRTFVRLREVLATHKELASKLQEHDQQIGYLFAKLEELLAPPEPPKKNPIGFISSQEDE